MRRSIYLPAIALAAAVVATVASGCQSGESASSDDIEKTISAGAAKGNQMPATGQTTAPTGGTQAPAGAQTPSAPR